MLRDQPCGNKSGEKRPEKTGQGAGQVTRRVEPHDSAVEREDERPPRACRQDKDRVAQACPTPGHSQHGAFTKRPGTLTNDFFVNLLDMRTEWKATSEAKDVFEGRDHATGGFVKDFVGAWTKVMNLDRYDLA